MTEGVGQKILLSLACLVIIIGGMKLAAGILVPFILAVFIAILASPLVYWMNSRGIPTGVAIICVIVIVALAVTGVGAIIGHSAVDFSEDLPGYQEKLESDLAKAIEKARELGVDLPEGQATSAINPSVAFDLVQNLFASVTQLLARGFLILLISVFILLEASDLPDKVRAISKRPDASLSDLDYLARQGFRYFTIKTLTSLLTGLVIGLWLWAFKIEYPVLLGLLAFLLNYIPNIGSLIAAIPGVMIAFVTRDLGGAIWAGVGYLAVNNIIGNFIEPRVMGKGLGLSTLVVFLSLIFWGWVLGPIGMLLSAPLTMAVKIALQTNEDTRPLALMLSSGRYVREMAARRKDATEALGGTAAQEPEAGQPES